jgi:hypothetical protein
MVLTESEKLLVKLLRIYMQMGYSRVDALQRITNLAKQVGDK